VLTKQEHQEQCGDTLGETMMQALRNIFKRRQS